MNIDWEAFIIGGAVAYFLAFYLKSFSKLIEKHGMIIFIFIHIPVFISLLIGSTALETENNTTLTIFFAVVFFLRFFKKDV